MTRDAACRIDKRTDLQIGNQVHQFIQFDVVIDVVFPLEQEFIQRNAALAQGKLGQAVSVSDWKRKFSKDTSPLSANLTCKAAQGNRGDSF